MYLLLQSQLQPGLYIKRIAATSYSYEKRIIWFNTELLEREEQIMKIKIKGGRAEKTC